MVLNPYIHLLECVLKIGMKTDTNNIYMKHIKKTVFIVVASCCFLGCSVQGKYYLRSYLSLCYPENSMKIVLGHHNKGHVIVSDTAKYDLTYKKVIRISRRQFYLAFEYDDGGLLGLSNYAMFKNNRLAVESYADSTDLWLVKIPPLTKKSSWLPVRNVCLTPYRLAYISRQQQLTEEAL